MTWQEIRRVFTEPLFDLGKTPVSLATGAKFALTVALVFFLASWIRRMLRRRVLVRTSLAPGLQDLISRIAGWLVIVFGMAIGLQTLGINLSALTVLAGAAGIGIGFGMQTFVQNFLSGLILMGERAIQIGDRVEVGDVAGRVERIGARSTSILTNDNIVILVPNSEFVSGRVVNWSHHGDARVRLRVPVGVSYGSEPRKVERLLLEVAEANPHVLRDPAPRVVFRGFGDSSLDFELRAWTADMTHRPGMFRSELNFAIWETFREHGVEIPFPQRDLHLRQPLEVSWRPPSPES